MHCAEFETSSKISKYEKYIPVLNVRNENFTPSISSAFINDNKQNLTSVKMSMDLSLVNIMKKKYGFNPSGSKGEKVNMNIDKVEIIKMRQSNQIDPIITFIIANCKIVYVEYDFLEGVVKIYISYTKEDWTVVEYDDNGVSKGQRQVNINLVEKVLGDKIETESSKQEKKQKDKKKDKEKSEGDKNKDKKSEEDKSKDSGSEVDKKTDSKNNNKENVNDTGPKSNNNSKEGGGNSSGGLSNNQNPNSKSGSIASNGLASKGGDALKKASKKKAVLKGLAMAAIPLVSLGAIVGGMGLALLQPGKLLKKMFGGVGKLIKKGSKGIAKGFKKAGKGIAKGVKSTGKFFKKNAKKIGIALAAAAVVGGLCYLASKIKAKRKAKKAKQSNNTNSMFNSNENKSNVKKTFKNTNPKDSAINPKHESKKKSWFSRKTKKAKTQFNEL